MNVCHAWKLQFTLSAEFQICRATVSFLMKEHMQMFYLASSVRKLDSLPKCSYYNEIQTFIGTTLDGEFRCGKTLTIISKPISLVNAKTTYYKNKKSTG